ncbi:reverse transcriptase domain-containing protein [Citrus sinensis]|nr:reverse transcriptase domain-containing protein [Citrus sinensis]
MGCKRRMGLLRGKQDDGSLTQFTEARSLYNELLQSHEVYWKQRSKILWLKEGDMNSKYFHATASTRKRVNTIGKLRNGQDLWCTRPEEVNEIIAGYFNNIFIFDRGSCPEVIQCVNPKISAAQNHSLLEPFTAADVRDAIFSMHPDKSSGPDAKMLANRLKGVLGSVISKSQSAFVPGRAITNNILISTEIMHYLKRKKQGRDGVAALKIDMSKAYDRIEWPFLKSIMLKLGFAADFVNLIILCVTTVTYKIVREGMEIGPIVPNRGLRQGDPLSLYLFIICAEGLSLLIHYYERAGFLHGARVARGAPNISHLFFADDCLLFFKTSVQEAHLMKNILAMYGAESGQRVNFHKSAISFSRNMKEEVVQQVCELLGVQPTADYGTYLGLPSSIGRSKSAVFRYIKNRVWKRLQGWSQKLLSRAGKEILLKTVVQAMPNYAMSMYLLPLELCRDIEKMMNSFWWGSKGTSTKGIIWMRWERLCKPKTHGGLGFKKLHQFDISMLGKQGWRFLTNPNSLVARLFKARYFPNTSFLEASLGSNPSYVWRSILAAQNAISLGSRIRIGGGHETVIGHAPWLSDQDNGFITSSLPTYLSNATVDSLMALNLRRWDFDVVANIFNQRDRDLILQIPLGSRIVEDGWYWLPDSKGQYTVRSCYKMLENLPSPPNSSVWRKLWQLPVLAKGKNFLWCAMVNVIPTADNLVQRRVEVHPLCPICNVATETISHVLLEHSFAKTCWLASAVGFIGNCWNVGEWLETLFTRCSKDDCSLATMICWGIWLNRNNRVWRNINGRASTLFNLASQNLFQWQQVRKNPYFSPSFVANDHGSVCWKRPRDGWFKCNVDAAISRHRGTISFGAIIRSSQGDFIAAKSVSLPGTFAAREAEGIGLQEALNRLMHLPDRPIVVEMDSLQVFNALHDSVVYSNGFGAIIADCRDLAQSLGEFVFSFVRRSVNTATHTVARVGGSLSGPGEWRHVPPPWLINCLG